MSTQSLRALDDDAPPTRRQESPFWAGVRATLPLLPGDLPVGVIYGVAARGAHVSPPLTQAMSSVIFAGSAQFAVVQLVAANVPVVLIVVTCCVLNLRHVLYSATLAPALREAPLGWRAVLSYLLTDETFGVTVGRLRAEGAAAMPVRWRIRYVLGSGVLLWASWNLATLVGLLAGAQVPAVPSLDFVATLTFIALAMPLVRGRAGAWAAGAAAVVAALSVGVPLNLGMLLAVAAGVLAGLLTDRRAPDKGAASAKAKDAERPAADADEEARDG